MIINFIISYTENPVEHKKYSSFPVRIGRQSSIDLVLKDKKVSRLHAIVDLNQDNKLMIIDQGSTGGSFVNDEQVEKQELSDGDEIKLGDTTIKVEILEDETTKRQAPSKDTNTSTTPSTRQKELLAKVDALQKQLEDKAKGRTTTKPSSSQSSHSVDDSSSETKDSDTKALEIQAFWGSTLLTVDHFVEPKAITIGEAKKCNYFITSDHLPSKNYTLIEFSKGRYLLNFTRDMDGEIADEKINNTFADQRETSRVVPAGAGINSYQYFMTENTKIRMEFEGLTFLMRFVSAPSGIPTSIFREINYRLFNTLIVSFFLHLTLIASFLIFPFGTTAYQEDLFESTNRFTKFILEPPEKKDDEFLKRLRMKMNKGGKKSAQKHEKDKGKAGKDLMAETDKKGAVKQIMPDDKEVARKTGLLRLLDGQTSEISGLSKLLNEGGLGGELEAALGGVIGVATGDSGGFGGLGLRGQGPGGGGMGNTIGIAELGTSGRGGGKRGYGKGIGNMGKKSASDIDISKGEPIIMGSLDREIIRRVIKRHINQIRYCYERELTRYPDLYGKVDMKFIINDQGRVAKVSVASSTLKNKSVEKCLMQRINRWIFPKPKGGKGSIVIVTYPFVFKAAGQ